MRILRTYNVGLDILDIQRTQAVQYIQPVVTDHVSVHGPRRLHRHQGKQLQDMVLHHIA